jgi:hypothetical protein
MSWASTVCIVSDHRLDDGGSIPGRGKIIFPLSSVSRRALRLKQLPIQCVPESFPGSKVRRGVTLTTHRHLVWRSRMNRSYTSFLPWCLHGGSGKVFFYFTLFTILKVIIFLSMWVVHTVLAAKLNVICFRIY